MKHQALSIYLIRHGETEWSLAEKHTSRTEIPLTERGEQEARALAGRLEKIEFSRVFSSPRLRAQRTCALSELSTPTEIEPDLAEWDYGAYEGRHSVDIHKDRPAWNLFLDGCPEGETPEQVSDRADRVIAHLGALGGDIAIFTHGHFACVLAARWIGLPVIEGQHFILHTASLSILGHSPSHRDVPVITLWNDYASK